MLAPFKARLTTDDLKTVADATDPETIAAPGEADLDLTDGFIAPSETLLPLDPEVDGERDASMSSSLQAPPEDPADEDLALHGDLTVKFDENSLDAQWSPATGSLLSDAAQPPLFPGAVGAAIEAFGQIESFIGKVQGIYGKIGEFRSLADAIASMFDTPEANVANLAQQNNALLLELQGIMQVMQDDIDDVLEGIGDLSEQIDSNLINQMMVDALGVMNLIGQLENPTTAQRVQIVTAGEQLMTGVFEHVPGMLEDAPYQMIAGQIAPMVLTATSSFVASVVYASDKGLGAANVQAKIDAADALLEDIFGEGGRLALALAGPLDGYAYEAKGDRTSDFTYETYIVHGETSGVYEFLLVETITGPNGFVAHTVIGDHTDVAGQAVIDDYPAHYTRSGSINGVSANGINTTGQSLLAGLTIDEVIPFSPDLDAQFLAAYEALDARRHDANLEVLAAEIGALGGADVDAFRDGLPSTFGLNEGDGGGIGADHIVGFQGWADLAAPSPDLIEGGGGDDTLEGLGERDALFGEGGYDRLYGGADNDKLFGGSGDDFLDGGDGHDRMQGDQGRDTLEGGDGHDVLYQGARGDGVDVQNPDEFEQNAADGGRLDGGHGNDLLVGDNGGDDLFGGIGHDTIFGYGGADDISGGAGRDEIYGGDGADEIDGDGGDDTIEGGDGDDTISGSFGDDTIVGGGGDDDITGGAGVDTVVFRGAYVGSLGGDVFASPGGSLESDFSIVQTADGDWIVTDLRSDPVDGVDIIRGASPLTQADGSGVEFLKFDNVVLALEPVVVGPEFEVEQKQPVYTPQFGQDFDDLTDGMDDQGLWGLADPGGDDEQIFAQALL